MGPIRNHNWSTSGMRVTLSYLDLNQAPNRKGSNLYKKIQTCIILESNLEFERAKGPTCSKYLHSSTGILSLIISELQKFYCKKINNLDK